MATPSLSVTTIERLKMVGGVDLNSDKNDDLLTGLIAEVSTAFETYLGRLLNETVTEYQDIAQFQSKVWLKRIPVTSITSVHKRHSIQTAWADATEITSSLYDYDPDSGRLVMDSSLWYGERLFRVIYVAGLATTSAALLASYPDITSAAERQIIHLFRRRMDPDASTMSEGGMAHTTGAAQMLPSVLTTLGRHRRHLV